MVRATPFAEFQKLRASVHTNALLLPCLDSPVCVGTFYTLGQTLESCARHFHLNGLWKW